MRYFTLHECFCIVIIHCVNEGIIMKKLLIALALTISSATYAATDTRAIRTSTDVVSIGDSPNSMIQKLGRPEASISSRQFLIAVNNGLKSFCDFFISGGTISIHSSSNCSASIRSSWS